MGLTELYHYWMTEKADVRVNDWWLMASPVPILVIQLSYIYFVFICGPRYMQNRKPYSLKTFITWYNVFQIVANAILVYEIATTRTKSLFDLTCDPIDYSWEPSALKMAKLTWWTLMLKLIDLVETMVFVLRKKDRQISFLHLYHHLSTVYVAWLTAKYIAGGMSMFSIMLNCFVHVIMYTYYLLATRGPEVQRFISPIKPYITIVQMVQFFILVTQTSIALLPGCKVPKQGVAMYLVNLSINFYLFFNFYRKNYVKTKKTP